MFNPRLEQQVVTAPCNGTTFASAEKTILGEPCSQSSRSGSCGCSQSNRSGSCGCGCGGKAENQCGCDESCSCKSNSSKSSSTSWTRSWSRRKSHRRHHHRHHSRSSSFDGSTSRSHSHDKKKKEEIDVGVGVFVGQPVLGQPGMNQPGLEQPGMNQPGMTLPGMNQPGMTLPGMNQPGMNQPGQVNPASWGGFYSKAAPAAGASQGGTNKRFDILFGPNDCKRWQGLNSTGEVIWVNGKCAPTLRLRRGQTYLFNITQDADAMGNYKHLFVLTASSVGNWQGTAPTPIVGSFPPAGTGVQSFTPDANTPNYFFYQDANNAFEGGLVAVYDASSPDNGNLMQS